MKLGIMGRKKSKGSSGTDIKDTGSSKVIRIPSQTDGSVMADPVMADNMLRLYTEAADVRKYRNQLTALSCPSHAD